MSALYFALTKQFLQPLPLLLLLVGVSLAALSRRRRLSALAPFLALFAACTPVMVYPVAGALEWHHSPLAVVPPDVAALVVLGVGINALGNSAFDLN